MTDEGHGGGVTLIQRLGPAANLNIPLHFLALDGVYGCGADSAPTSRRRDARKRHVAIVSTWLVAGTRVAEMGATLLTCKCVPQRPVWGEQIRNSNVAYQSFRDRRRRRKLTHGRNVRYGKYRATVVQRVRSFGMAALTTALIGTGHSGQRTCLRLSLCA